MFNFKLNALAVFLFICNSLTSYSIADEIVISGNEHEVSVGDFDFSPCNTGSAEGALAVLNHCPNGEMTAGDQNLTICMDWSPDQQLTSEIDLSSLQLKIEDPTTGGLLTNVSLNGNSLIVPGFEVSSFKPEAELSVALGYDFMKRFGPQSTEKIHVASNGSILPSFSFKGTGPNPNRIPNLFSLLGFVLFWLVAFKCLAMATAPKQLMTSDSVGSPSDIVSA